MANKYNIILKGNINTADPQFIQKFEIFLNSIDSTFTGECIIDRKEYIEFEEIIDET